MKHVPGRMRSRRVIVRNSDFGTRDFEIKKLKLGVRNVGAEI